MLGALKFDTTADCRRHDHRHRDKGGSDRDRGGRGCPVFARKHGYRTQSLRLITPPASVRLSPSINARRRDTPLGAEVVHPATEKFEKAWPGLGATAKNSADTSASEAMDTNLKASA
jgi:hypothetical protein